eukprot:454253-Pelagomonas_calceolata.AAC.1
MGIWRVDRHASGRSDSPSPVLRRRTIKVKWGQIIRPGIEAHHLKFQCVDSQRFPFSIGSQFV